MTDSPLTLRRKFHIASGRTGHRVVRDTAPPAPPPPGRIPRISRLMALAIRFEQLIRDGVVKDQADLARLAQITRARVTQIMDLLLLAPEIQEEILFLPHVERGKDRITERGLRSVTSECDWRFQRGIWKSLRPDESSSNSLTLPAMRGTSTTSKQSLKSSAQAID